MLWAILAFIATIIWVIVVLLDKYVVTSELKDPLLATVVSGLCMFIFFGLMNLFKDGIIYSPLLVFLSLLTGVLYTTAVLVYYYVMKREDASKVSPALATGPLFTLVLGFFFLAERFTTLKYVGVIAIVIGAILLSFKESHHHFRIDRWFLIALAASFLFAARHALVKYITLKTSIWSVFFWMGLGSGLTAITLLITHHPHIRKKANKGVKHLILNGALTSLALYIFSVAISLGPVSLVMAVVGTQPLFVFISATLLSMFLPSIIYEKISREILLQKLIGILLIIAGAILVL